MQYLEFINNVGDRLGWGQHAAITTDPTDEYRKIIGASNSVLKAMQSDRDWPELNVDAVIPVVVPVSEDDIANITKGDATLTLDGASTLTFAAGDVGKVISIAGHTPYYTIASYTGVREVELDRIWTGTSVTLGDITVAVMSYELPSDYDRVLGGKLYVLDTGTEIDEVTPKEMKERVRKNGIGFLQQEPQEFTVHGIRNNVPVLHLDSVFTTTAATIGYSYQKVHPDIAVGSGETDDYILYPPKYILYIEDQVVAMLATDAENSTAAREQDSNAMREAIRANSSPSNSRERTIMKPYALRHGDYRRW